MFKKLLIKLGIVKPSSTSTEIKKNLRKATKTTQQQKAADQFYEDMETAYLTTIFNFKNEIDYGIIRKKRQGT